MTSITLNGEPALDPIEACGNFDALTNNRDAQFIDVTRRGGLIRACNRFAMTSGPNPSYGYFVMTRKSIDKLKNTSVKLIIKTKTMLIEQEGLVMVRATSMAPITYAATGWDGDMFVVEVADRRFYGNHPWLRLDNQGQKLFNVVSPVYGKDQYYTETLDPELGAGLEIPWSWQSMLDEVWPTWLGDSPTLPHSYASDPVGFDFRGVTNYQAVTIILTALNKQLALNTDGSFSAIDSGSNNDTTKARNDRLRRYYKPALDEALEWIEPVQTFYPKGVKVHFPKTATNSGSENVFTKDSGQWYADMEHVITVLATSSQVNDNITNLLSGSYQQMWDDMPAWTDPYTGTIENLAAITARATERANEFYENFITDDLRIHEVYSQLIDFELCGTLQAVSWSQSYRRGGAWVTEIFCHPRQQMMVSGGELIPEFIQPVSPWQWRAAPIYPPETMLWRNDGFLSSGSSSGTQDDEYNGHEVRYDPATKTFRTGIYVKGVPTA